MILVLDTNVFVYDTHMLGRDIGQQLLELLKARHGQLFIPEILSDEYLEQARAAANDYQRKLADRARDIRTLLGQDIDHGILSEATIDQAVKERLKTLESITRAGPLIDDLHVVTSKRVIAKKAPVTKSDHGHKDCMIWEAILTLPPGSVVWLISRDGGFFDKQGLLRELVAEAQERGISIQGHRNLDRLLQELRSSTLELDLAAADITLKTQNPPEVEPSGLIPLNEPPSSMEGAAEISELDFQNALERVRRTFDNVDARVLGFISYLNAASKEQLFALLNQAGVPVDIARNSAERLAHGGAVRDTGSHYLVQDRALALAAASRVEEEIIGLISGAP